MGPNGNNHKNKHFIRFVKCKRIEKHAASVILQTAETVYILHQEYYVKLLRKRDKNRISSRVGNDLWNIYI